MTSQVWSLRNIRYGEAGASDHVSRLSRFWFLEILTLPLRHRIGAKSRGHARSERRGRLMTIAESDTMRIPCH